MWRCIHDNFNYCKTEPDGAKNARMEERATKVNGVDTIVKINMGFGATCSLNPKTCGKLLPYGSYYPEHMLTDEPAVLKTTIKIDPAARADKGTQQELT